MDCSNCGEPLEAGGAFCGNCGQALRTSRATASGTDKTSANEEMTATGTSQTAPAWATQAVGTPSTAQMPATHLALAATDAIPPYAVPVVAQQAGDTRAALSPLLGVVGVVGGLFIPLAGLLSGTVGLVLSTLSRHAVKRRYSTVGLIVSLLAVVGSLASWAYAVNHDPRFSHKAAAASLSDNGPAKPSGSVITPCYKADFLGTFFIQNISGSCNAAAFNGATFDDSSDAYRIYATQTTIGAAGFTALAKQAIEKDVQQNLPAFTITQEKAGSFAGSPAYFVSSSNGQGVSVMEAAAWHANSGTDNFFVFVHAVAGNSVNLNDLQAGWQWQ